MACTGHVNLGGERAPGGGWVEEGGVCWAKSV